MPLVPLLSTGSGYKSQTVSSQRRQNMYCEIYEDADKTQIAMFPTPGMTAVDDTPAGFNYASGGGAVRGATVLGNLAYVVVGSSLYLHDQSQVPTQNTALFLLKTNVLSTFSGRVGVSTNGTQVMIVDGLKGYIYNINTTAFNTIVDANFPNGCTTVTFLNGYFIVEKPNTGQFWWSNIYDGLTWNALQFATAESNPDNLVAVSADHGILILLGERTSEFWGPSGTTTIWQRIGAAGIEWGIAAKWSFARFGDDEIFLAQNRQGQFEVIRLSGYTANEIGSPDVIHDMNELFTGTTTFSPTQTGQNVAAQATAFSYMIDKHLFYQINFPTKSYLYDGLSNCWSEVSSWNDGAQGRHYAEVSWSTSGLTFVSDYRGQTADPQTALFSLMSIYFLDVNGYTDEAFPASQFTPAQFGGGTGDPIIREWQSKHVFANLDRMTIKEFFIEVQAATALQNNITFQTAGSHGGGPAGANPQLMLQWSKDGGFTWGNEIWMSIGTIGNYLTRCVWRALGRARDFMFLARFSDPVKFVISNAGMIVE